MNASLGALLGLIGVLLGGGVRAWELWRARRLEADALLSALCAEVEALTRLINHRRFGEHLSQILAAAEAQVAEGRGHEAATFATITLKHDYFTIYKASAGKLGQLHPYYADRIVRFYEYLFAVQENYDPTSHWQQGMDAHSVVAVITNDLLLLHSVVMLGTHIGSLRNARPPKGVKEPLFIDESQPALPESSRGKG